MFSRVHHTPACHECKEEQILRIITVWGTSTKLSKFFTQDGDSSTFFFSLLFKFIFVLFLFLKLAISNFSKAASIDSALLSSPPYWFSKKLRAPQTSSSEASLLTPRRLYGSQTLTQGNLEILPEETKKTRNQYNLAGV